MNQRILTFLIEDRATIRENLTATLEELTPVQVLGFAAAEQTALDWLRAHADEWQLLIVDIFLQAGNGLSLLAQMPGRSAQQYVVILSNYITSEIRAQGARLGVDAVFDKSQDLEKLIAFCQDLGAAGGSRAHCPSTSH